MNPTTHELLRAVADGDISRVRALLATGADVNSTNNANQTALMLAASFKRSDIVSLLMTAGASLSIEDELGLTAVDWANNDAEIVTLINAAGEKHPPAPVEEQAIEPAIDQPPAPRATGTERIPDAPALTGLAGAILRDQKLKASAVEPAVVTVETDPDPDPEPESQIEQELAPDSDPEPESHPAFGTEPEMFSSTVHLLEESADPEAVPFSTDDTLDKTMGGTALPVSDDTLVPTGSRSSRGRIFAIDTAGDAPEPRSKVEIAVPGAPKKGVAGKLIGLIALVVILGVIAFGAYRLVRYLSAQPVTVTNTAPLPAAPVVQPATPVKSAPVVGGDLVGAELHLADAEYPAGAQQSGTVTVKVRTSQKGIVVAANAVDGDEALRRAAERAARSSAFSPEKLADKGAFIEGTITYSFVAPQSESVSSSSSDGVLRNEVTVTAGGPLAGTERNLVKPEYPANARRDGIRGTVTIVVRVSNSGQVVSWRPLDGKQELRAAAVKVVRDSVFEPAKLPGNNDVVGTLTYTFR